MLPDFPSTKTEWDKQLTAYFVREVRRRCPGFEDIPRHFLFEGETDAISREGEEREETKMFAAGAEMMFSPEEISNFDWKNIKAKMDKAAEEMAAQMTRHFYQTLSDACDRSGQVTRGRGGGFTADKVLEALEMIQIDFEAAGKPNLPSIHIAPSQFEELRAALEKLETDPEYSAKFEAMMQRKFGDWRDREASRKLVG